MQFIIIIEWLPMFVYRCSSMLLNSENQYCHSCIYSYYMIDVWRKTSLLLYSKEILNNFWILKYCNWIKMGYRKFILLITSLIIKSKYSVCDAIAYTYSLRGLYKSTLPTYHCIESWNLVIILLVSSPVSMIFLIKVNWIT